jgi:DNA-binding NarL/FixJ family response regulator
MGAAEGVTVFLAAQNRLLREALSTILSKKNDIIVVGSSPLSLHATEEVVAARPDVLVLDSFASSLSHGEFIRDVKQRSATVKLVMIGMELNEQHFLQAVREGALGYVLKDASALDVVSAVRAVANGEAVCPPKLCCALFRHFTERSPVPTFRIRNSLGLTNREQQLVWLISQGLTNKEIASQLQLADQTIRNHVHRMLRKLGASHRLAAVDMCREQGLAV